MTTIKKWSLCTYESVELIPEKNTSLSDDFLNVMTFKKSSLSDVFLKVVT